MRSPYDPYRAPGSSVAELAARPPLLAGFEPLEERARMAAGAIALSIGSSFAVMGFQHPAFALNVGWPGTFASLRMMAALFSIAAFVTFLQWTYRAAKNVQAFGRYGLRFTPGWAVGSWFIPIVNFVTPFVALREVWRASDPDSISSEPTSWKSASVPAVFWGWWITFWIKGSPSFAASGRGLARFYEAGPYIVVPYVLSVVSALAIGRIMFELARRQRLVAERLAPPQSETRTQPK